MYTVVNHTGIPYTFSDDHSLMMDVSFLPVIITKGLWKGYAFIPISCNPESLKDVPNFSNGGRVVPLCDAKNFVVRER
jgi:hypothetical protein